MKINNGMSLAKTESKLPVRLEDLTRFVLIGREKLNSVRAGIRAITKLGLAKEVREQKLEEGQMLGEALLDAESKIGEMLSEIPNKKATSGEGRRSLPEGITHKQSHQFQQLSENQDLIEQVKAEAIENEDIPTRTAVLKLARERDIKKRNENLKNNVVEFPEGKYQIIYADPPWRYWEGGDKNQSQHYSTMGIKEISELPIKKIADEDCILFLWVTFPILKECFEVIESWGFKYSTCGFVWVKKNKKSDSWFFGNGSWTRANTELCLIATKGKITRLDASISQIVCEPIRGHSQKPEVIYELIEKLVGKLSRIELFARNERLGWHYFGNEIKCQ